jgi:hypothetical protein
MVRARILISLASAILAAGCASAAPHAPSPFHRGAGPTAAEAGAALAPEMDITIVVQNDHSRPMRVWVDWPELRHFFLGQVESGGVGIFQVPRVLVAQHGPFRFHAGASGLMDEVFTDAIDLRGKHWVELSLRKVLAHSKTRVR